MPTKLVWRRCGTCGQLTLVPVSANVCWQCGAPLPEPGTGSDPSAEASADDVGPLAGQERMAWPPFPFVGNRDRDSGDPDQLDPRLTERNLPPPKPRPMDLTPEDDAVATQLLESVFPDGLIP